MIEAPAPERISIQTRDGFTLAAQYFSPLTTVIGGVLISPALAVPQRFYQRWARYLSSQGFAVLSYDYRGIGASQAHLHPRAIRSDLLACVRHDAQAALEALALRCAAPLAAAGHSFGGALVGLLAHPRLNAALQLASPSARVSLYPLRTRLWLLPMTGWVLPMLSRAFGYTPARLLRLGEDVPLQAMLQWCRATQHAEYLFAELNPDERQRIARFSAPLLACHFSDDWYAPRSTIVDLLTHYPSARSEMRSFTPAQTGLTEIGHFGAFRSTAEASIWRPVCAWLASQLRDDGLNSNTA